MKKRKLFACIGALMMFFTSCTKDENEWKDASVEIKDSSAVEQVQSLVQQARYGNAEAYKTLAYCYRDGNGVEKSDLNAMLMYSIYCEKTGKGTKDIMELYEEGNSFKLMLEILDDSEWTPETDMKMKRLQQLAPAEVKTIEAIKKLLVSQNEAHVLETLLEAESEGSELAGLLQALYHEQNRDTTMYRQCMLRLAVKHPILNAKIGQLYETQYVTDDDFPYVLKAMEYYYKADSCGMLTPRMANHLWSIYDYFSQKGMLEYNEKEVERLRKIMKN